MSAPRVAQAQFFGRGVAEECFKLFGIASYFARSGSEAAMLPHLAFMSAVNPAIHALRPPLLFEQQCCAKFPGAPVETIGFWNGFPYEEG